MKIDKEQRYRTDIIYFVDIEHEGKILQYRITINISATQRILIEINKIHREKLNNSEKKQIVRMIKDYYLKIFGV